MAVRHFFRYLNDIGSDWLGDLNEDVLADYATWRYTYSKVIGDTVDTELSGICSYFNKYLNGKLDRKNMFMLKSLMDGFKKYRPSKGGKAALVDKVLKKLIGELDENVFDDAVLRTALIFKKCLILRNSEGWRGVFKGKGIGLNDLEFVSCRGRVVGIVLAFNKSKTNQYGRKQYASAPCLCVHKKLCAVHEVLKLMELKRKRGHSFGPDDGLFLKENGLLLSYEEIGRKLKELCVAVGINAKMIAPHSLRKGGATDYISWGVPPEVVKDMGQWKLMDSMDPYRKLDANAIIALASKKMSVMFKLI